jgi:hydroxyacylglutathione hydrolase
MVSALEYLGTLPDRTIVFVGHEYTKDNLAFAKHIDPSNAELTELQGIVEENDISTGQSTIGDEKKWNLFMRLDSDAVRFVCRLYLVCLMLKKSTGTQHLPRVRHQKAV